MESLRELPFSLHPTSGDTLCLFYLITGMVRSVLPLLLLLVSCACSPWVPAVLLHPKEGSQPKVQPEVKPEVQPEVKPEVQPEIKPEVRQEVKPKIKPKVKPSDEFVVHMAKVKKEVSLIREVCLR